MRRGFVRIKPDKHKFGRKDYGGVMLAMSTQSFELGEHLFLIGEYSWRLKDGELRYRGKGEFAHEVLGRIPVTDAQIERFTDALDLLQVWEWRDDYDPEDIEIGCANSLTWVIEDGGAWWFKARLNERTCRCAGGSAFPSYADHRVSSLSRGAFCIAPYGVS